MPTPSQTFTLASRLDELPRLMAAVHEIGRGTRATAADLSALELALEEIVTNVITHGFRGEPGHSIAISLEASTPDRIRAVVMDDAGAFNPLDRPEADTQLPLEDRPVGGLGVHLVRKLMDLCLYERRDGRNHLTIERQLGRESGVHASVNIAASKLESATVLSLTGRLDGLSSPEIERQVQALIGSGVRTLIFDLSGLEYVSSAGLRVLLLAAKQSKAAGGGARFASLSPPVQHIFQISGLLAALEIHPTVESAMAITPRGAAEVEPRC